MIRICWEARAFTAPGMRWGLVANICYKVKGGAWRSQVQMQELQVQVKVQVQVQTAGTTCRYRLQVQVQEQYLGLVMIQQVEFLQYEYAIDVAYGEAVTECLLAHHLQGGNIEIIGDGKDQDL